jgi:prevent-host-death family protein
MSENTTSTRRFGLKKARAILPTLIQEVAAGARVIITVRGIDKAVLAPAPATRRTKTTPKTRP